MKSQFHSENIVNVANGTLAVPEVNVDKAVTIGHNQLVQFEKSLPTGFWKPIERKIKTGSNGSSKKRNCYWIQSSL